MELIDGRKVNVKIDLQTKDTIEVYVQNRELTGKFNMEIYKYSLENGSEVVIPYVDFSIIKVGALKASTRKTDTEGMAHFNSIAITGESVDDYELKEGKLSSDTKYIGIADTIRFTTVTGKSTDGSRYELLDAYFENGRKETTVSLTNGKTVTLELQVTRNTNGVNVVRFNIENPPIEGRYMVKLAKVLEVSGQDAQYLNGVTFDIRENDAEETVPYETAQDGKVKIADKVLNYDNVSTPDKYVIEEIKFENNNKYVKLKNPLTLIVEKGKNKYGEEGTENAPGTKFVITKMQLRGSGRTITLSGSKYINSSEDTLTLSDIALEDGTLVNIVARLTEETDSSTGEKVQLIEVTIPNIEREGSYQVEIRKVDASGADVSNATFKAENTINGVVQAARTTDRTVGGYTSVANVRLDAETLETVDTYKISEVNIYKNATENDVQVGYAKLASPITLSVTKGVSGNKFVVSSMSLSQEGIETVTSTTGTVTLRDVNLEYNYKADITATLNDNKITLTIPNKEITGGYSLKLVKTRNNFTENVQNAVFRYTGNVAENTAGERTDRNGEISIVDSYSITKSNVEVVDNYEFTEDENKTNNYLELAEPIGISVEKGEVGDKFVVTKITMTAANQTKTIVSGGESQVQIDGIKTVKEGRTTSAKLAFDETTQMITLTVDNPLIDGEFSLKIKKVDMDDKTKTLQGVTLKAVQTKIPSSGSAYEVVKEIDSTTQANGYAYVVGDNPYTTQVEAKESIESRWPEIWYITETSTLENYQLLDKVQLQLKLPKKLSSDGKSYVIDRDNVELIVIRNDNTDEAYAMQEKLKNAIAKAVSADGTEVTITLGNEKYADYGFKLMKTDADGNPLAGAVFTVVDPNGDYLVNNQTLPSDGGTSLVKTYENVKPNTTYKFEVTEDDSASTYVNLLDGFKLEVSVKLDEDGIVDLGGSSIEIIPLSNDYDRDAYIKLNKLIEDGDIKLTLEANNTAGLTIINEKVTTDYRLKLIKTEIDYANALSGAKYSVTKDGEQLTFGNEGGVDLTEFVTDKDVPSEIDSVSGVKANTEIVYEIEEVSAPANYRRRLNKVRVNVNVDNSGNVSAAITKVLPLGSTTTWLDYSVEQFGGIVKLERVGNTNEFEIRWSNNAVFEFLLYKEGYNPVDFGSYSSKLIASDDGIAKMPILNGARIEIAQEGQTAQEYTSSPASIYNYSVKSNSEYIYTITENEAPTNYENDFEGVDIRVHLRTDENAKLVEADQDVTHQASYFEIIDKTGRKTEEQLAEIESKAKLVVIPENNSARFFMVDTHSSIPSDYSLMLFKKDDATGRGLQGAEFEITHNNGTTNTVLDGNPEVGGTQNFTTDASGMIRISNIPFDLVTANQIHTFTIREVVPPQGYTGLGDKVITVTVNLSNKTSASQISMNDISVNVSGTGDNRVTARVYDGGAIALTVPNDGKSFKITVRKTDTNGDLIKSSYVNDVKQGTKVLFKLSGSAGVIINGEQYFDEGEVTYTQTRFDNSVQTYTYQLAELAAKYGYANKFKDFAMLLIVKLDADGNVIDVNPDDITDADYTHVSLMKVGTSTNVTYDEVKELIKLKVETEYDGTRRVIIDLVNPNEYKLRLRKTDTDGNELDKAWVQASLIEDGNDVLKAELDGTATSMTDAITIKEGETQTWVVEELSVEKPYTNILNGNKKLYITAKMENKQLTYDYEVRDVVSGNLVTLARTDEIYDLISVNLLQENNGYVIDVQIENPSGFDFAVIKGDINQRPITSAAIQVNEVTNINGATYNSRIDLSERMLKIGDEKTFVISELRAEAPYVNVLGNNKLFIKAKVVSPTNVEVSGIGYIDEANVTHNGTFGPFAEYIVVPERFGINNTTKLPTMVVYLKNPIEYKVRLYKVDSNNKTIKNADFELIDQDENIYRNENSEYIETTRLAIYDNDTSFFTIKENASAFGYNNILENWDVYFKASFTSNVASSANPNMWIQSVFMRNRVTGEYIYNADAISNYFTYEVVKENEIPVIIAKIKNTTDYNLNIVKQTTSGIEYSGAKIELYEVNPDTTERSLLANNIVNDKKQANLTLNNISVLPNKTYSYVIKEVSTEAPHVNILGDDKEVRLNVKLVKDEDTSALSFEYNYDIYNRNGEVLANDIARSFITFEVEQDTDTGKYTLNMYIQNPIQLKMKFRKTDMDGNEIPGKATISINDVQNNGAKDEIRNNLKIGDTITLQIKETNVEAPFVNVLPNNSSIVVVARVMENEKISIIYANFIDNSTGEVQIKNVSEIAEYFTMSITEEDGIQVLNLQLKNPAEYKVRILKQDMAGLGLEGADFQAAYAGQRYSNEGRDYIEIPVTKRAKGDLITVYINENESKVNYKNVFGSNNTIEVQFKVNDDYTLSETLNSRVLEIHSVGKVPIVRTSVPGEYFNVTIDNMVNNPNQVTAEVVMKNPIEYDIEFVKQDLSGEEISGDELKLQVTRNSDEPVSNEGKSTIKFSETKLAPNTVNTYVVEELSTIAPHINGLEGKKAILEVRVDGEGNITTSIPVIVDDEGNVYENDIVLVEPDTEAENGKKIIKVAVKNPMSYRFKLTKTTTLIKALGEAGEATREPIIGTSIQVNDITNVDGANHIDMTVDDVKVGDTKLFVIKENSTPAPYENILENKEIRLTTRMGSDKKLHFVTEVLKDTVTGESVLITNEIKEQYRFDYEFVTGSDGIETLEVNIENPIKFNIKVVKKDATGVTELSGTEIELLQGNEVIADNRADGRATLEYTAHNVGPNDRWVFRVNENSSVSPNQNILQGKSLLIPVTFNDGNLVNYAPMLLDPETASFQSRPKFVTTRLEEIDGFKTIIIELENPVDFDLDIAKNAAGVGFLQNTKFQVYREGAEEAIFDGFVKDINTWKTAEVQEHNMDAGRYTYYITETRTARQRYINVLENKYVKLNLEVTGTGKVTVMNNNWEPDENYFEIYEGDVADRKDTDILVDRTDKIYEDISLATFVDPITRKQTVQIDVTNPLKYIVELEKYDIAGEKLSGAEFEVVSSLIDEQNAERTEMDKTVGVDYVAEDGTVTGTTNRDGIISFQESHVYAGTYEYELRETQTPGKQYVNPIEGYTVHFKVSVAENGNLKLEFYENGKKFYIEKDGEEAPEELYKYVFLATENNTIIAKLQIQVENPVRFRFSLRKEIYGDENVPLGNADFKVESSIVKEQKASYRTISKEIGITDVTESGVISATTNAGGYICYDETMVSAGIYEYWITEIRNANEYVINPLEDKYIKVYVKVDSDGTIHTVAEDGQIIEGKFYLYERDKQTKINFAETGLDELITVETTGDSELNVLKILIDNPEYYNVDLIKFDKDTNEEMNGVVFKVNTYEENAEGERVPVDIKHVEDVTKGYDTSELVTSVVSEENGHISIDGILIEKAGTYYYEFVEETPQEPIIYKDKAENVIVKVVIDIEEIDGQRQYVVKDTEIVQGERYVLGSEFDTNNVETRISNERIKGSYDIEIDKLEELLGGPVSGATFAVRALRENTELNVEDEFELYKATDDVNSKDVIIPTEFTIEEEDGKFVIEDIRIERPETYIIEIEETEAPDTYTILRDVLRLRITTGISGENDDAKYVLESVEIDGKDNDGLVQVRHTEDEIIVTATNNQFDLALRKFIVSINGKDVSRWTEPETDTSKLITGEDTTAEYYNSKVPLRIYAGQEIIYTLRVYNEGQIAGYANKIVDHLPEQLEFLPDDEFNTSRRWKYVEGDETKRAIETDYLSKYVGEEVNLIKPFDTESGELDYVEVQVKCRVKDNVKARTYVTNIAEITEYEGYNRPNVIDRDNYELVELPSDEDVPLYKHDEIENDYVPGQEDDDDFEKVIVEEFDLALRKFITQINEKAVTSRVPVFKVDENGNYYYEHDKTPLIVAHNNLVEYTLRVYNEGTVSGYATLIKDNIPEGLVFVPDNETNKEFGWVMLDADENETSDVTKAKYVVTDYLKDDLIKSFEENMAEPDSRDLKVVFRVDVPVRRDDVIVNEAQISDDKDDFGEEVNDKDSTPDEWNEGEDDQDREYIKVKYFDLALYKWVSTAIVTQDGKTTEYESGHTQEDKSNMVNVSIPNNKVNGVVVKFRYVIKVENQGNLAGYAKEIKDHIPAGLKFVAEDNAEYGWVDNGDGTIVTDYLKDTLLEDGETAEVPVTLTWINGSDNLGQKFNYAEISKDYNDYGSPDVDSKPDNFTDTPHEDDEDGDVVLLQIRTGMSIPTYVFVGLAAIMIVVVGVVGIKKFVLNCQ